MWGEELTINIFGATLLGSVIVAAIVAKLKVWLKTTGWINTALALASGALLGIALHGMQSLMVHFEIIKTAVPIVTAVIQGLFSGGIAAGLWKVARTIGPKNSQGKKG